jgi:hypothetical protein
MTLVQFWELSKYYLLPRTLLCPTVAPILVSFARVSKLTLVGTRPVVDHPWIAVRVIPGPGNENANATLLQDLDIVLINPEVAEDTYTVVPTDSKTLKALR